MNKRDSEPLSFLEVLGSVFAAAVGVQSKANKVRDFTRGKFIHFALVGILFTMCFVGAVVGVVQLVLP